MENDLTLEDIARRVEVNRAQFETKFNNRKARQDDYYVNLKKSLSETYAASQEDSIPVNGTLETNGINL